MTYEEFITKYNISPDNTDFMMYYDIHYNKRLDEFHKKDVNNSLSIVKEINEYMNEDFGGKTLSELVEKYGSDAELSYHESYGYEDCYDRFYIIYKKTETKEEIEKRMNGYLNRLDRFNIRFKAEFEKHINKVTKEAKEKAERHALFLELKREFDNS